MASGVVSDELRDWPETIGSARAWAMSFVEVGGPAPPDDDLLLALLRVKRILEVPRAPADREPRWDRQLLNLRSLQHLPT